MSKATFTPAVTEIREVDPAKVTLELTIREAQALLAVLGNGMAGHCLSPVYHALDAMHSRHGIQCQRLKMEKFNADNAYDHKS